MSEFSLRSVLKELLPPILVRGVRMLKSSDVSFSGRYADWSEARAHCHGYEQMEILEKVKNAALAVKRGEAAFERDSMLFSSCDFPYPTLAGILLAAASNGGRLKLIDFGGGLGSLYFQLRPFLTHLREIEWCVIEQAHFAECGRRYFSDDSLFFYSSIEECMSDGKQPTSILLSSVLPYLEEPHDLLAKIKMLGFDFVVIDRTPLVADNDDLLTVQTVKPPIYDASYPSWLFSAVRLRKFLAENFLILADFQGGDGVIRSGGIVAEYRGFVLKTI